MANCTLVSRGRLLAQQVQTAVPSVSQNMVHPDHGPGQPGTEPTHSADAKCAAAERGGRWTCPVQVPAQQVEVGVVETQSEAGWHSAQGSARH